MGNPTMDEKTDYDSRVPFAHGMALISDELYKVKCVFLHVLIFCGVSMVV